MKAGLILFLGLCCQLPGQTARTHLRWEANFLEGHGFQTFERPIQPDQPLWFRQQGVVFITPDRLAVYQVNKRLLPAPLAGRDASGGSGNFFLDIRIFDARDGHEIQSMHLPTNGEFSKVVPAGGGKFVVRTGDVLYLLSPVFKVLASKALPLLREAPLEAWQVDAPPSGAEIILVHQQIFIREVVLADGTIASPGKSKADVEILDPDTLKPIKSISLSSYLAHWSTGDRFLVATHPSQPYHAEEFGALDFDGQWKNLRPAFKTRAPCPPIVDALDHQLIAAYGCNGIVVFSESGDQVFYSAGRSNEGPVQVSSSGDYFAIEFVSLPNIHISKAQPSHIDVFDIKGGAHLLALPLKKNAVYFNMSAQGSLAVVEGDTLRMFAPGE